MKKYLIILLTAAAIIFTGSSFAANVKVGIVDMQQILQQLPALKTAQNKLQKDFAPRDAKIKVAVEKFQKGVQALERNASVMSEKQKSTERNKLAKEEQSLQTQQVQFRQDFQTAQAKVMQTIFGRVNSVVSAIAKKGHYDLILQKTAAIYYKPSYEITQQVIRGLK